MTKAEELEEKWGNGCENDTLDPGDVFGDTIAYCHHLEASLEKSKGFVDWLMENCELAEDNSLWSYNGEDYTNEKLYEIYKNNK